MIATCFQCNNTFDSKNPEDEFGDGKCPSCLEKSKRVAFKVDIDMAAKRRNSPFQRTERAEMIQDLLKAPEGTRINARDLGIL